MSTFSKIAQALRLTGGSGATNDMVGNWLKGLGLAGATPDMLFTYLRSTGLTGSLPDMLSAYVFSSGAVFIDLEQTSNGFFSLSSEIVFANDFEVEFNFAAPTGASFRNITGAIASSRYEILFTSSGDFTAFDSVEGQRIVTIAGAPYSDGRLHLCKVTRVGGLQSLFLDGVLMGSKTMTVHNVSFGTFGNKGTNTNRYDGIIANLKLTDITTPANSLEFKLNELTDNTETNNDVTLTYNNIGTGTSVRDTYVLSNGGTQYISDLRTIDIAPLPAPLFNSSGVLTCSGQLSCSTIIPCGE
jgi:hypothetical protein